MEKCDQRQEKTHIRLKFDIRYEPENNPCDNNQRRDGNGVTGTSNTINISAAEWGGDPLVGGHHGMQDWTPGNGTNIAGNHTGINKFTVAGSTTVYVNTGSTMKKGV